MKVVSVVATADVEANVDDDKTKRQPLHLYVVFVFLIYFLVHGVVFVIVLIKGNNIDGFILLFGLKTTTKMLMLMPMPMLVIL